MSKDNDDDGFGCLMFLLLLSCAVLIYSGLMKLERIEDKLNSHSFMMEEKLNRLDRLITMEEKDDGGFQDGGKMCEGQDGSQGDSQPSP